MKGRLYFNDRNASAVAKIDKTAGARQTGGYQPQSIILRSRQSRKVWLGHTRLGTAMRDPLPTPSEFMRAIERRKGLYISGMRRDRIPQRLNRQ
jgi:hypothetical protein